MNLLASSTLQRLAGIVGLAVLVIAGTLSVAKSLAQETGEQAARATPLAMAFAYQGRVEQDGVPATGFFDFEFRLFDSAVAGSAVGPMIPADDLQVTNGLFSIALNFGADAFEGSERFLEVKMRPGTGGAFAQLGDRQAMTATPYALYASKTGPHSHFGDTWSGPLSPLGVGLTVEVTGTGGDAAILGTGTVANGLSGQSTYNSGVYGTSTNGYGVQGFAPSTAISGVRGLAGGSATGVSGLSVDGIGTYGSATGTGTGVLGESLNVGVRGHAVSTTSTYGVYGDSVGIAGVYGLGPSGVLGSSSQPLGASNRAGTVGVNTGTGCNASSTSSFCVGVAGIALADPETIGVYGKGVRWGVYSDGALGASNAAGIAVYGLGATGVSGVSTSVGGAGVMGTAHTSGSCNTSGGVSTLCYGVVGDASATPGTGGIGVMGIGSDAGIWGRATGPTSYAAIFDGRVHFNGILDGPSGQIRTVSFKPDFDGLHNLGFNGAAYGEVVTYDLDEISDIRRKKDIEHIAYGLDEVLALNPVSYQLRNRDSGVELGLIAQEVREIIPEVVDEGDDPDHTLAMDYTDLIPVLIKAIQEQDARIDALGGVEREKANSSDRWLVVGSIALAFLGAGFGLGQVQSRRIRG